MTYISIDNSPRFFAKSIKKTLEQTFPSCSYSSHFQCTIAAELPVDAYFFTLPPAPRVNQLFLHVSPEYIEVYHGLIIRAECYPETLDFLFTGEFQEEITEEELEERRNLEIIRDIIE